MTATLENLDYLAARIHGRRSQIAEAQRLDALCRLRSLEELGRAVLPGTEPRTVVGFQRQVVLGWLREMEELALRLGRPRARLIEALSSRLRVEDEKLLVRGIAAHLSRESLRSRLLLPIENSELDSATSLEEVALALAKLSSRDSGAASVPPPTPFLLETTLDRHYLQELLGALHGLLPRDRAQVRPLIHQEVDHFLLMVVVRGRFLRELATELLLPCHVEGAGITRATYSCMLSAPDLPRAAAYAVGSALDGLPPPERCEPATLEAMAWNRFQRLARRTFRESTMGFATLVAYAALRRVEVANLITLSEGIRLGVGDEAIRARLLPRAGLEAAIA
jgi:vacuolar-type H+-ATPase subunit C/Vma6